MTAPFTTPTGTRKSLSMTPDLLANGVAPYR